MFFFFFVLFLACLIAREIVKIYCNLGEIKVVLN